MVTQREAKKILLDLRSKNRQRQREWKAKMEAQGYKRISVMISGDAHRLLNEESKRLDLPKGNVLSDMIEQQLSNINQNVSGNSILLNKQTPKKAGTYDREIVWAKISELHAQELSYQQIADRLNADGIPTATGKGPWLKGTVGNIVKKLKEGNQ